MTTASIRESRRSGLDLLALLVHRRDLAWALAKREICDRYAGQAFGAVWAFAHPLILMGVYVFIFAYVFYMRIGETHEMPRNYAIYILAGLIPWVAVQESLSRCTQTLVQNASLVKQVVFPLELLPVKVVVAALITQGVMTLFLAGYTLWVYGSLPWTYVLLPVLFALQFLGLLGIGQILAAVGTYFRDLKDIVQVVCTIGVYLMPTFYLPDWVPQMFRPLLYANPFSYLVWCYQDIYYFGRIEHPEAWLVLTAIAPAAYLLGCRVFRSLKPYFGSVL